MDDCTKCGEKLSARKRNGNAVSRYCGDCRWLLKLHGQPAPHDVARFGLPRSFDDRQALEIVPRHVNVAQWPEPLPYPTETWRALQREWHDNNVHKKVR